MFTINPALLPSLTTRKALLIVDAQNDFLAEDGALPVKMPIDLPQKLSDLANDFRRNGGEIIWVQSQFESSRPVADEQMLITETPYSPAGPAPVRSRRSRTAPPATDTAPSPEAFLTLGDGKEPHCVRPGDPGAEMHPIVKQAVGPNDRLLVKSFYSAFKVNELLRILRVKFVTELFICGSSTNTGVMATAIEAASYGYTITIVEDCCGSQSLSRHRAAIRQVTNTTGCDVLSAASVLGMIKPQPATPERVGHHRTTTGGRSPTVRVHRGRKDASASSASAIVSSIERLSLSDKPAADDEHAPEILAQEPKQQQPSSTLQPVAGPEDPQTKEQRDKDTVAVIHTPPSAAKAQHPVASKLPAAESSGDGHNELEKKADVVSTDGSTRYSVSVERKPRPSTPPPELSPELRLSANTGTPVNTESESKNVEVLASPTSTNAGICPSPKESCELLGTPRSTALMTLNHDTATAESTPTTVERRESKTMTTSQDSKLAESEPLGEGDTKVFYDVLPEALVENIFERIKGEVNWQRMSHQGGEVPRLVAVQGQVGADGSKPIYRHPADESPPLMPFTPAVDEIRRVVEAILKHPVNHVLIQLYRHGNDYISEHSDKTLDIVRDSFIANVSVGAERTMTLRTKRPPRDTKATPDKGEPKPDATSADGPKRSVQRARLPHNSLFQMGLATNMRWMHAIRQDKRLAHDKSAAELAYEGVRISLTFRRIGTFLDSEEKQIWGQGATGKTRDAAHDVINGQTPEAVNMLKAFGRENQSTKFDWDAHYGSGFDVLNITAAARLFLSADPVVNMRVQIMLAELGVGYARGSLADQQYTATSATSAPTGISPAIKFVDNDDSKTIVEGQRDIMLYLQKRYGASSADPDAHSSSVDHFEKGLALLDSWRASPDITLLTPWETHAANDGFISGPEPGLVDFAVWPVLHCAFSATEEPTDDKARAESDGNKEDAETTSSNKQGKEDEKEKEKEKENNNRNKNEQEEKVGLGIPNLRAYYLRVRAREAVARTLAASRGR
ncbi:hypothetical protein GGS21DRAFT_394186 [Xylaria nigripes]|nr:hypothetical protein GGS21DRAFT_394186 [Xylaria nigripes]